MCTVSWRAARDGYDLFFNRDELNTRAPESAPSLATAGGVPFLAPRDGDHGGTWLAVNEYGLTVCLLNDYANPWRPAPGTSRHSRGHLVLACTDVADFPTLVRRAESQPLARTLPFTLLALAADGSALVLRWDGTELKQRNGPELRSPLSSSSFSTDEVIAARQRRFTEMFSSTIPDTAGLARYHREHDSAHGAHSVLMQRPDAATHSISHVKVTTTTITLSYTPVGHGTQLLPPHFSSLTRLARSRE